VLVFSDLMGRILKNWRVDRLLFRASLAELNSRDSMADDARSYIDTMLATYRERLRLLEQQYAQFGIAAPAFLLLEIQDIHTQMAHLTLQQASAHAAMPTNGVPTPVTSPRASGSVPHVFVSYSHRDSAIDDVLCRQLRIRGLRLWRDQDSLGLGARTETAIREALVTVDAALLYLTPESLASRFIMSIELPAVLERYRLEPTFPVLLILDGVTLPQIDEATLATGIRLSDFNAVVLAPAADEAARADEIADVARRVLQSVLGLHLRRSIAHQALGIDLFSQAETTYPYPAPVCLNWVQSFTSASPAAEHWRTVLLPALHDLYTTIRRETVRQIALRPAGSHLSAGYAFGYVFRATTGVQLWIEQTTNDQQTHWWRTDSAMAGNPLDLAMVSDGPTGGDTTIELSVSRDVELGVYHALRLYGLEIERRIQLRPHGGPSKTAVADGAHASAIARQVESVVADVRRANPSATIHLFGAMPIGLAVLLGTRLNRCGPIQCYEWHQNVYHRSCRLDP
jgi:CBASS immunity sensor of nucleotide second messenger signals/TIR domain-containing protein